MKTQKTDRSNYQGFHILTDDFSSCTDTWKSGINNNVLVFGPSGSGKTRHYVRPNVLNAHGSMIISDTKGSLYDELGPVLKRRGYRILNIDFTDLTKGSGYNPLHYIRYDAASDHYSEKDILTLCHCLIEENKNARDPFWEAAARQYLACLISYVLEALPSEEHDLASVVKLIPVICSDTFDILTEELDLIKPGNTTSLRYASFSANRKADKMDASIRGILSTHLDTLVFDEALALYGKPGCIDFASLGRRKTALFLTVSDTDRSMDKLANAFMTQAIQILCRSADKDYPEHRLPVPVHFYLDDFATNLFIPDFDKIISVIRSREISVSVILQSITQLYSLYGRNAGKTIINNCDQQLYLGGQDPDTADYISVRANKPAAGILNMPLDSVWLLIRGQTPRLAHKYVPDSPAGKAREKSCQLTDADQGSADLESDDSANILPSPERSV